ncbi:hypothetical protein FACS189431_5730 [Alphaproteobacteria bacterium]|nr:hypothetical protein FACS189431_5730 [Alphaproteobacteria bacterium]
MFSEYDNPLYGILVNGMEDEYCDSCGAILDNDAEAYTLGRHRVVHLCTICQAEI